MARECSNTLARRDPPVKCQSQRHRNRSSSNSSSSGTNSDDNHRYRSSRRHHANHDRRGYRNDQRDNWRESTRSGRHRAHERNSRQDGRDDNYRRKMAGMILIEGITPTVPHMVITGEGIIRPPRKITTEVPVIVVILPPLSIERVT